MKYYKEYYNPQGELVKGELTRAEAAGELKLHYGNIDELLLTPRYYPTLFGGILVEDETAVGTLSDVLPSIKSQPEEADSSDIR